MSSHSSPAPPLERPLVTLLAGFAAGLLVASSVPVSLARWLLMLLVTGVGVAVCLLVTRERRLLYGIMIACVAFALGGAWLQYRRRVTGWRPLKLQAAHEFPIMRLDALVLQMPAALPPLPDPLDLDARPEAPRYSMTVRVEGPAGMLEGRRLRVLGTGEPPDLVPGHEVRLTGFLLPLRRPGNPGQVDYEAFFRRSGVVATLAVPTLRHVQVDGRKTLPSLLPARVSAYLRRRIRLLNGGEELGLMNALLLGDRRGMSHQTRERFRLSGTMHYVAISGLHVGIAALSVWTLLTLLTVSHRPRLLVALVFVWLYALLTGAHEPTLRAAVMISAFLAAPLLGRRCDVTSAFAAGVLVVLILRPAQIAGVGFHLSVLAVWAILYLYPRVRKALFPLWGTPWDTGWKRGRRIGGWALGARRGAEIVLLPVLIWVVLAPMIASVFHLVTPVAPLATLVLAPLLPVALLTGLLSLAAVTVSDTLGCLMLGALQALSDLLETVTGWMAGLPGAHFYVGGAGVGVLLLFYLWLAAWPLRGRLRLSRAGMVAALLLIGALALVDNASRFRSWWNHTVVLDVGQGLSTAFIGEGTVVLYDAGGPSAGPTTDVIAHFLWHARVPRIDALILSHPDSDHCNAVAGLLDRFRIENVIISPAFERVEAGERVISLCRTAGTDVHVISSGYGLRGGSLQIDFTHPDARLLTVPKVAPNELSLTCHVRMDQLDYIMTGDVEEVSGPRLVALYRRKLPGVRPTVLWLPHHGEPLPVVPDLLAAVRPAFAVASGRNQMALPPWLYPLMSTGDDGALIMKRHGRGVHAQGFESKREICLSRLRRP